MSYIDETFDVIFSNLTAKLDLATIIFGFSVSNDYRNFYEEMHLDVRFSEISSSLTQRQQISQLLGVSATQTTKITPGQS